MPDYRQAAQRMMDPRGITGILSRGRNIYRGGSNAAHRGGGPQFGRPKEPGSIRSNKELQLAAIRRLQQGRK